MKIYIDGDKEKEVKLQNFNPILKHGALVLGQDQDAYLGDYDEEQSFQGNMTSVNMWDYELSEKEISDLTSRCPSENEGNLIKWTDFLPGRSESVKFFCGFSCSP